MEDNSHPDQSIWGESSLHQTRGAPYPGASALTTEYFGNLYRASGLLIELHNRQTREDYQVA